MRDVHVTFRPLTPDLIQMRRREHRSCQFRSSYSQTMELLNDELRRICVHRCVIQIDVPESQIRNDGMPYATAKPSSPMVCVSFEQTTGGPLRFPCDTYSNWQDNLRAIAKTLEALRAVDRYGATRDNQQYAGWKALPGGDAAVTTAELADKIIREAAGLSHTMPHDAKVERIDYRRALKNTHPDRGGDAADFNRVQEAGRVLGLA